MFFLSTFKHKCWLVFIYIFVTFVVQCLLLQFHEYDFLKHFEDFFAYMNNNKDVSERKYIHFITNVYLYIYIYIVENISWYKYISYVLRSSFLFVRIKFAALSASYKPVRTKSCVTSSFSNFFFL